MFNMQTLETAFIKLKNKEAAYWSTPGDTLENVKLYWTPAFNHYTEEALKPIYMCSQFEPIDVRSLYVRSVETYMYALTVWAHSHLGMNPCWNKYVTAMIGPPYMYLPDSFVALSLWLSPLTWINWELQHLVPCQKNWIFPSTTKRKYRNKQKQIH